MNKMWDYRCLKRDRIYWRIMVTSMTSEFCFFDFLRNSSDFSSKFYRNFDVSRQTFACVWGKKSTCRVVTAKSRQKIDKFQPARKRRLWARRISQLSRLRNLCGFLPLFTRSSRRFIFIERSARIAKSQKPQIRVWISRAYRCVAERKGEETQWKFEENSWKFREKLSCIWRCRLTCEGTTAYGLHFYIPQRF